MRHQERFPWLHVVAIAFILTFLLASCTAVPLATRDTVTFTVSEKDRITKGSGESVSSVYMIWTEGGEVFECSDQLIYGKFNSADMYGQIEPGQTYDAVVCGFRVPLLSWNRNIISVETR